MKTLKKSKGNLVFLLGIALVSCFLACSGSDYYRMEKRELASGERNDSLFFGLYLGMPAQDFYVRCWELNKQGMIWQGTDNTTVFYPIESLAHPAEMDFYPIFYHDSIVSMPITFAYTAWAPWNKHLFADTLKEDVLKLMEEWYGTGFIEVENPDKNGSNAYVKVDGNRRISIYNVDDRVVKADITDLPFWKEMKGEIEKLEMK